MNQWLKDKKQFIVAALIFSVFGTGVSFALPYVPSDAMLDPTCAPGDANCYVQIIPSLTAGSVVFHDGTNLAEDNTNFFWDDSANKLTTKYSKTDSLEFLNSSFIKAANQTANSNLSVFIGRNFGASGAAQTATSTPSSGINDYGGVAIGQNILSTTTNYTAFTQSVLIGSNILSGVDQSDGSIVVALGSNIGGSGNQNQGVFIGQDILAGSTAASGYNGNYGHKNVAIGRQAMYRVNGGQNTAVGALSLAKLTTGYMNTAIGIGAGNGSATAVQTGLTGYNNTFLGAGSTWTVDSISNATAVGYGVTLSQSNTVILGNNADVGIGTSTPLAKLDVNGEALINGLRLGRGPNNDNTNTIFGYQAFNVNSSGFNNVAIGYQSLYANDYGESNVSIGYEALRNGTGASYSVAIGEGALKQYDGQGSVAIGYRALEDSTGGTSIAIGSDALGSSLGTDNIGIGSGAGNYASGGYNVLIGDGAGGGGAFSGSNNIFIGRHAGLGWTSANNNIMIGYDIEPQDYTQDNTLNIGNLIFGTGLDGVNTTLSTGNVGIGDPSPTAKFTVGNGSLFQVNSSGAITAATGISSSGTITFSTAPSTSAGTYNILTRDTTTGNVEKITAVPNSMLENSSVTFATGSSGTDVNWSGGVSLGGTTTLNIPDAGASARGLVTTGAQTFAGAKTFSSAPTLSTMTSGSVLFAGTSGVVTQDNASLFWDNTNKRLGINSSASPSTTLDIKPYCSSCTTSADSGIKLTQTLTGTSVFQNLFSVVNSSAVEVFSLRARGSDGVTQFLSTGTWNTTSAYDNHGYKFLTSASAAQGIQVKTIIIDSGYSNDISGAAANTLYGGKDASDNFTISSTLNSTKGNIYLGTSQLSVFDEVNGRLGIGDATPAAALTVGNGDLFQVNSSGAIAAATGISSSGTITFSTAPSTSAGTYNILTRDTTTGNVEKITAVPNSMLENSSVTFATGTTGTDVSWSSSPVSLGGTATINIPDASTSARGLVTTGTQTFAGTKTFTTTSGTNSFKINTSGATTGYGAVTVEGDTPSTNLVFLSGSSAMAGTLFGVNRALSAQFYSNNQPIVMGTAAAYDFTLGTTATARLTIKSSGNIGIGDTSPASLFTVGSGDLFQVNSSGAIAAATGITSSGTLTLSTPPTTSAGSWDILTRNISTGVVEKISSIPNSALANSSISFATGTTGTDVSWSSSPVSLGGTATINIPDAGASARGLVTTGAQTFAGAKTFSSAPIFSTMTLGSVLFAGISGTLTQDNTNFFWDDTNNRLGILDATPTAAFTVGSGDLFQINSSGAIAAATGITSSGIFSLTAGTSTDSFIDLTSTGDFLIKDNSATFVTFTDAGRVGIGSGATAPSEALLIKDADSTQTKLLIENTSTTGTPDITLYNANGGSNTNYIKYFINGSSGGYNEMSLGATGQAGFTMGAAVTKFVINTYNGDIIFGTNSSAAGVERMRISTGGLVSIGGDTTPDYKLDVDTDIASNYAAGFFNDGNNDNRYGIVIQAGADTPSANRWIQFNDGDGTDQGSICYTGGQANICAPSDIRLKKDIVDTSIGLNSLLNIKVRDFVYISDGENRVVHGFIAQELVDIYPDAVSKPTDPNEMWKVSYNQLTPLIIKSIQDLDLKVNDLSSLDTAKENSLAKRIQIFLADIGNGIESIYTKLINADKVQTKELCVGDTCVTESQFLQMVQASAVQSVSNSPSDNVIQDSTPIENAENTTVNNPVDNTENSTPIEP